MAQNEVEYKVRIARNKQGKNGEVIRIKFGDAVLHRTGIPTYDRCFVGIRDGKIFFKFFNGLSNVISKFDDSKMFRIQSFGNMPGITITSKRFLDYFAGFEGEYDVADRWNDEPNFFVIEPSNRRNFTNLYKNTSTTVTQKEEDKLQKQLDLIHRNSIYGVTQVKPADSMTPDEIERLRKWHDEGARAKSIDTEKDIQSKVDLMVIRESYTGMYLKLYYKALEKKDEENVGYFKFKILGCLEFTDYRQFVHDVELALKGAIACGEKDYAELILDSIPDLYELTRDYN